MRTFLRGVTVLTLALLVLAVAAPDALAKKERKTPSGPLDEGKLDPAWFGGSLPFVETEEIDYLWVKEGFSFEGKSFHFVDWEEHEFLGEKAHKRDENDHRLARQLTGEMAQSFSDIFGREFGDRASTSTSKGSIKVVGRIVDCSTGSVAAKALVGFGAGSGNTTIDVKFIDTKSGELVAAFHHRVVSGTNWSTTDSKFFKWVGKAAEELVEDDFGGAYQRGKAVRK